jgi:hypothetical protein
LEEPREKPLLDVERLDGGRFESKEPKLREEESNDGPRPERDREEFQLLLNA